MKKTSPKKNLSPNAAASFPIVAIGASAGGLEALQQLFAVLPNDIGSAFVVIQHLDPSHPSMLTEVLATNATMPVVEISHGMPVEVNRVHVIPAASDIGIASGAFKLLPRPEGRKTHLPIDSFFRALADDQPLRAIGVVLSGSGSDGTEGLAAIKAGGGITCVQSPESAQFRSMPESAIAAGVADFILAPENIAQELIRLSHHDYWDVTSSASNRSTDEDSLVDILARLRQHAHRDFRGYKRPTLLRRIARRMALRQQTLLADYAKLLHRDRNEAKALAQDILIHVTAFFRDSESFEALKQNILPELLKHKDEQASIRFWVPGCSTGQEAYSLAILLLEVLDQQKRSLPIKIFASDLSESAVEAARAAIYTETEVEGVSPERLAQFFESSSGHYRIVKRVRDLCVFVRHDLTRDPPFARLDLISCRNVLIYFDSDLQRRILPLLHYCLNEPGYLFLGSSETVSGFENIFFAADNKHRIFLKTGISPRLDYPMFYGSDTELSLPLLGPVHRQQSVRDAQRQADHFLLTRYAPAGVVVNSRFEVVQFRGRTGDFLEAPPGQPQINILKLARDGLVAPLREALESAQSQTLTVRKEDITLHEGSVTRTINLEVTPLLATADAPTHFYLVVFEDNANTTTLIGAGIKAPPKPVPPDSETVRLRAELATLRNHLQAIGSEYQDAAEELAAANEELVAANEELQSTNEELQSAKEELQSTNEELSTLNDELRSRNHQLDLVADDLVNVLESVQIPVIIVDHHLRIRRFTPTALEISNLLPGDIGRSIDDVKLKLKIDDLVVRIRQTIDTITPKEWEVCGLDGRWFRLHIRPYRTADNRLDGAILSFVDIDALRQALRQAELARDFAQRIVETVPVSLVVLDQHLRIISGNSPFFRYFSGSSSSAVGQGFFSIAKGAWNIAPLREIIERSLKNHAQFRDFETICSFAENNLRTVMTSGSTLLGPTGELLLLLAIEDISDRRLLEASEKQARIEAEQANRAKDLFLATLSHELRTPLGTILMSAQLLQRGITDDPRIRRASAAIERAVGNQARLIDDLLDVSRIVSGKLILDLQAVDLAAVVQNAVDVAWVSARNKNIELDVDLHEANCPIHGDPNRLQQVVSNLLNNAIKFTQSGGKISVRLEKVGDKAKISVQDTGIGIRAELLPHLFNRFVQAESAITRAHGGLGLGLAIVRHLVTVHGGEVHAESLGEGKGAAFVVTLPLALQTMPPPAVIVRRTVARSIHDVRVLLIDDDDDAREACKAMLESMGAIVKTANSAASALAVLHTFIPQVILSDIAMPGEDGYALIRRLQKHPVAKNIPAAALTALAGEDDRRRALAAGFQMHLTKPIDAERLASAIGNLVTQSSV